ncbi:ATP-dependent helicase [Clostridium sp.]|jgi:DNA helicase II / ATP-dependent DNA helicase PcrA|uniref:ATP-dependent helicase n=1 Tax=Clostridium sp. TaxID=1506 RepID=UPI003A5C06C3
MELDRNQKKAVYTNYNSVVICAPPGSGKTTVIINRILNLVYNRGVDPNNILVITFTKAAALNMKDRYIKISKGNRKVPYFSTFHSLFYRILIRYYKNKINIIDEKKSISIIRETLSLYVDSLDDENVRCVLNDISRFKTSNKSIDYFRSRIDKSVFKKCFYAYEEYKNKRNLMDFDDLQFGAKELLLKNKAVLKYCRNTFRYILVDEFQDSDDLQIELLKLISQGNSIFAVGDEDQCIYGFRGSNPNCIVNFDKYFNGGKKLFLDVNYRSVKNIVELSKVLIINNKNRNQKIIKSCKSENGKIEITTFKDEYEEVEYMSSKIRSIVTSKMYTDSDIAVLYRTNLQSRDIIDSFLQKNIKFRFLDEGYNFFNHFICRDIIAYFKLSIDEYDMESFSRIINRPFRYISKVNINRMKNDYAKENCFDKFSRIGEISVSQIRKMKKLKRNVSKLKRLSLYDAVDFIVYRIGYIKYIKSYCKNSSCKMRQLKHVLDEFRRVCIRFNNIDELLKYVEEFSSKVEEGRKAGEGIILSTIHGVKGMEFKNVFIINCDEEIIPHANSIEDSLEEERRLFYVGITRAIDNLHLYSVESVRGKKKNISRFIREILKYNPNI